MLIGKKTPCSEHIKVHYIIYDELYAKFNTIFNCIEFIPSEIVKNGYQKNQQ